MEGGGEREMVKEVAIKMMFFTRKSARQNGEQKREMDRERERERKTERGREKQRTFLIS